jgi:hypothetical protein
LARELGHGNVEHIDVLAADEVQQQVKRPFERFEEHLERLGRDVQVLRQLRERLAIDARERLRLGRRMREVERRFQMVCSH